MITTENLNWLLYCSKEDFIIGTNLLAVSAGLSGLVILDEVQMNNHHHIIVESSLSTVEEFIEQFRKRLRRFQLSKGNNLSHNWGIRVDQSTTLSQLRSRIGYVDRNAYVARLDSTPHGYPWGSGFLLFNGNLWMMQSGIPWSDLSVDSKRTICRSHDIQLPDSFRVLDGLILRHSFVNYKRTEKLFNSANQYYSYLSKHGEADIEIARLLGENIQLPNEELYQIVGSWFPGKKISELPLSEKCDIAKKMKTVLNSSNKQISQILRLSPKEVDGFFPRPR